MRQPDPNRGRGERLVIWILAAVLALGLNVACLGLIGGTAFLMPTPKLDGGVTKRAVTLHVLRDKKKEEPPKVDEPPPQQVDWPSGQLVEIAPPDNETPPAESEYLAEYDSTVKKETRSERYEVNPEVLSPIWSQESKTEQERLDDLNMTDPSTGAEVGNDRFDPDRDGALAALPSRWRITNKEGLANPVPASLADASRAGAPQNDLLDEEIGEGTYLNTKEFLYASYLNRIKRLVNFYWQQNVDNLPPSVRFAKPRYTTAVLATLDSDGRLQDIGVTSESGSPELDDCVVRAFKLAGPFPNPPAGLVEPDGLVHLPDMQFTVILGMAQQRFEGIDPRAGVQFPGILKSPR